MEKIDYDSDDLIEVPVQFSFSKGPNKGEKDRIQMMTIRKQAIAFFHAHIEEDGSNDKRTYMTAAGQNFLIDMPYEYFKKETSLGVRFSIKTREEF